MNNSSGISNLRMTKEQQIQTLQTVKDKIKAERNGFTANTGNATTLLNKVIKVLELELEMDTFFVGAMIAPTKT